MLSAVRQLKLEHPEATAKQVHELLGTGGSTQHQLSAVKKACSKAAKLLAKEPSQVAPVTVKLVCPPAGSVVFLRCQLCQARVKKPQVCAGCCAVCYCSEACARKDREHLTECANTARHMACDVSVSLPEEPAWLVATGMSPSAGPRHSDVEWCDLLEAAGLHDNIYCVLCGCVCPSSPHCYVPNPLAGLVDYPSGDEPDIQSREPPPELCSWASYYEWRGLPSDAPVALLLAWPLTVYHCLVRLGLASITDRPITIHYLGPEKEVRRAALRKAASPTATVIAALSEGSLTDGQSHCRAVRRAASPTATVIATATAAGVAADTAVDTAAGVAADRQCHYPRSAAGALPAPLP